MSSKGNNQINNKGENTNATESSPVKLGSERTPMGNSHGSASNSNLPTQQEQSVKYDTGNLGASFGCFNSTPTDDPCYWEKRCSWVEELTKGLAKEIGTLKAEKEALKSELEATKAENLALKASPQPKIPGPCSEDEWKLMKKRMDRLSEQVKKRPEETTNKPIMEPEEKSEQIETVDLPKVDFSAQTDNNDGINLWAELKVEKMDLYPNLANPTIYIIDKITRPTGNEIWIVYDALVQNENQYQHWITTLIYVFEDARKRFLAEHLGLSKPDRNSVCFYCHQCKNQRKCFKSQLYDFFMRAFRGGQNPTKLTSQDCRATAQK